MEEREGRAEGRTRIRARFSRQHALYDHRVQILYINCRDDKEIKGM